MKPFSMSLSRFKKIAQDHISTTLKDPDGHEIKIVHSRLPPIQRKQLEGLPMAFADGDLVGQPSQGAPIQNPSDQQAATEVDPQTKPIFQAAQNSPNLFYSSDQTVNAPEAVKQSIEAEQKKQAVNAAQASAMVPIEQARIKAENKVNQHTTDNYNMLSKETQSFADDIKNMNDGKGIDPNHWAENRSVPQKIANAFGLLAGGLGQGLIGGSNPAMDFINAQIDRDLNAQKENVANRKSVLAGFQHQFGEGVVADNMARIGINNIYTHQFNQNAARLGTPAANAAAQAFAAQKAIENDHLLKSNAARMDTFQVGQPLSSNGSTGSSAAPSATIEQPLTKPEDQTSFNQIKDAISGGDNTSKAAEPEKTDYYDTHILAPDAAQKYQALPHILDALDAKADDPEVRKQYKQAALVEKALGTLNETIRNLSHEASEGSVAGELKRRGGSEALHHIPFVGNTLGAGFDYLSDSEANRRYAAQKERLVTDLKAAFRGTETSPSEIERIVDANAPERGDNPDTVKMKRDFIRSTLLNSSPTNLLEQYKLAPKRK